MLTLLTSLALALPPEAGATGIAEFTNGEGPDVGGYGAGLFATSWVTPWLAVDGHVQVVAGAEGVQVSFFPEVRLRVTGGDPARGALALAAGFGARFPSDVLARGTIGAVADIPVSERVFVRPQVRYLFSDLATPGAGQFGVGLVWRGRPVVEAAPVIAEVAPAPVAAPPPAPTGVQVDPPGALVWLPHPVCQWVPAAEVGALMAQLLPEDRIRFVAAGYLPQETVVGGLGAIALKEAPAQGSVLVVAEPGDVVSLGGQEIRTGADGVAVISVPEGVVSGVVTGGGRVAPFETAVGNGFAVWVRAPSARPLRIDFARGETALGPDDLERLGAAARSAGGWMYIVQGSASPDGNAALNGKLADERAAAVAQALYAAGMARNRVVVRPAVVAGADVDPAAARFALVMPVPLGGGP